MKYWLMKSEPHVFGLDDLKASPGGTNHWDGVRNYQARNYMCDMKKGDRVFFYHSNCPQPGIAGLATVAREAYPDHTAFDPENPHYDPRSDADDPRWFMVDVKYERHLKRVIPLAELKRYRTLDDMPLTQRFSRLSVMPVTKKQWDFILGLEGKQ